MNCLATAIAWLESKQGWNLVSDDDGRWAVSTSGTQPAPVEGGFTETVDIVCFVEPYEWKPTILEAIQYAMNREELG